MQLFRLIYAIIAINIDFQLLVVNICKVPHKVLKTSGFIMRIEHKLFLVLGIAPKSRARVSTRWTVEDVLKFLGSLLLAVLRR